MGLHLYSIGPAGHAAPRELRGIGASAVRTIDGGGVALWVSEHERMPDASIDTIRQHNAVVVAGITDEITPVPIRFGQWFRDDAAAIDAVSTSHTQWMALLERFRGAAEYGVRIFDPEQRTPESTESPAPTTGTEYMAALAARARVTAATAELEPVAALRAATESLVAAEKTEPLRTAHGIASVAHLVHRSRSEAYLHALDVVRSQQPQFRFLSTGPWPPYSFVA